MKLSKAQLGKYSLLRHKKYREKERLFMVQGTKAVNDTRPFFNAVAIVDEPSDIRKISTLENLPDVIAIYELPPRDDEERLLIPGYWEDKLKYNRNFCLLLDGVQDPGNLGTILRTAHWFGIKYIFCSRDTVDVYNPKVIQSTMGSIGKVRVVYTDLRKLIDANPQLPVYGLLLEGENIFEKKVLESGFIVMGSEGHGHTPQIRQRITSGLTIPPANASDHPESLNVSIATAITLSQLIR